MERAYIEYPEQEPLSDGHIRIPKRFFISIRYSGEVSKMQTTLKEGNHELGERT